MRGGKLPVLAFLIVVLTASFAFSGDEEKGKILFNDTNLGTNSKSCSSCHSKGKAIDAGRGRYSILGSQQESIEDAVNFCIKMALSGKPLEKDSEKMNNMVSYLETLKGKKKRTSETPGY